MKTLIKLASVVLMIVAYVLLKDGIVWGAAAGLFGLAGIVL